MGAVIQYNDVNHNLPTPKEIRSVWCFGLPLYDSGGNYFDPDDGQGLIWKNFIMPAIREVERRLAVFLKPTIIICSPNAQPYTGVSIGNDSDASYAQPTNLVQGTDYDRAEPPYDYDPDTYLQWGFMQLREYPFLTIERIRLVTPNYIQILNIDQAWIKAFPDEGQYSIVPYAGSPTIMTIGAATGMSYPFLAGTFNRFMPQVIWVDYTAGYAKGRVPDDVRNTVAKLAAIELLRIAGDALISGITNASLSVGGVSQSAGTTVSAKSSLYQAKIDAYKDDVKAFFDPKDGGARQREKGFTMSIL